jgi:CRP-like cAMP-binding protein
MSVWLREGAPEWLAVSNNNARQRGNSGEETDDPECTHVSRSRRLDGGGIATHRIRTHDDNFAQGDPATRVMYVDSGAVRLSVLSHAGKEAVIAVLDAADFFGEGCLASQSRRMATATAMAPCTILSVEKADMVRELHARPAFADRFLTHMLTRNIRIEEDLIDQLFNSSEKRLARTLLLLARYGKPEASHRTLPKLSQETLAEMVRTTRSRVNFFMNKFRKLGFIEYNGDLKINNFSSECRVARLTSSNRDVALRATDAFRRWRQLVLNQHCWGEAASVEDRTFYIR